MALLEDLPVPKTFLGLGLAIVALPIAFPSLRPLWATAVKGGVKLYLEASGEAEAELVDALVACAVDKLVDAVAQPVEVRDARVPRIVSEFKAKARARSNRKGRGRQDRERIYDRHIATLKHRLAHVDGNPSAKPHLEEIGRSLG